MGLFAKTHISLFEEIRYIYISVSHELSEERKYKLNVTGQGRVVNKKVV